MAFGDAFEVLSPCQNLIDGLNWRDRVEAAQKESHDISQTMNIHTSQRLEEQISLLVDGYGHLKALWV